MHRLSKVASSRIGALSAFGAVALALSSYQPSIAAAPEAKIAFPVTEIAPAAKRGSDLGEFVSAKPVSFEFALPLRNQASLDELLRSLYNPADPLYGKYLSSEDFITRFSPSLDDVHAVTSYALSHGLSVDSVAANRTLIHVSGPVSTIESLFAVQLHSYKGADGRVYHAPDREPTLPVSLAGKVGGLVGISNYSVGKPFIQRRLPKIDDLTKPTSAPDLHYTGFYGLDPSDVRKAYSFEQTKYTGKSQTVAVFEIGTFFPSDPETYEQYYGTGSPNLVPVSVDGYDTNPYVNYPGGAEDEIILDLDLFTALAPQLDTILIYENTDQIYTQAAFEQELIDTFQQIGVDPHHPTVTSVSYGLPEDGVSQSEYRAEVDQLEKLAAQGQSVCVASGDAGAYEDQDNYPFDVPNGSDPATEPYITSVGGTDLLNSITQAYLGETTWADAYDYSRGYYGTGGGGGISAEWQIQPWQKPSINLALDPQASTIMRNFPDVSLYGDYDTGYYDIYEADYGGWTAANGTSASSPLWASFLSDLNQALLSEHKPVIGFANPALYSLSRTVAYPYDFHDVTLGDNLYYIAGTYYDNATGLGSFIGDNLLGALSGQTVPTVTKFSPASGTPGTTISLAGTNLTTTAYVSFNGVKTTDFTVVAPTKLTVVVPAGATTGPITIVTTGGGATYAEPFTVYLPAPKLPTITSFTPTAAVVGYGVEIYGTGLSSTVEVTFNGTIATKVTVVSDTEIKVIVPAGATTGPIEVSTTAGLATSSTPFTVKP